MASGDFTPFATQQAVQQAQTTADNATTAVGDDNSGLTKDVADLQAETANLQQLIDNMSDPVFALTTHTPSGVYTAGQTVYVGGSQYRANSDMDGSVLPISFVVGSGANQWTPASKHNKEIDMIVEYGGYQHKVSPAGFAINDGSNAVTVLSDPSRKRLSLSTQGASTQANLANSDFMTYGDFLAKRAAVKAFTTNPTEVRAALVNTNGELSPSANITETELNYLNGVTSRIQDQIDSKVTYGASILPTENRVAALTPSGELSFTSGATITEFGYLDGVTSNIQTQLNGKLSAPSQLTSGSSSSVTGTLIETSLSNLVFGTGGVEEIYISGGGSLRPLSSSQDLGKNDTNERWQSIYLANNPNVSSDRRLKTDINSIPDSLLDVWLKNVKPVSYMLISDKDEGCSKRQVGLIAQDVIQAFQDAGLDWRDWGVIEEDEKGFLSINYNSCSIIESAAIRRKIGA